MWNAEYHKTQLNSNSLTTVSTAILSILFADDTITFSSGMNLLLMFMTLNEQLTVISEWLSYNELSLH